MAATLTASTAGHFSAGASSLSSSFLPQSKLLPSLRDSSYSTSSISGHGVSLFSSRGCRSGARCGTMAPEAPISPKSLYSLLGLEQGVGIDDIKTSYRKLARRYHPDVCPAEEREECTKMFLQVQDAYEVLSDPERRARYDYQLMNPLSPGATGWGSMVRRSNDREVDYAAWRSAWREQLDHFPKKERQVDSWAARMRAKHAQDV